jgi:transposase
MAAFSLDLRQRVLDAALRGDATEHHVAERFRVSRSFVQKLKRLRRSTGSIAPSTARRGPRPRLSDDDRDALVAWADGSDATGAELAERLSDERGVRLSAVTVNRALRAAGLTPKKRPSAPPSATGTTSQPSATGTTSQPSARATPACRPGWRARGSSSSTRPAPTSP